MTSRWFLAFMFATGLAGAAASCAEGTAGQVCKQPNAADCKTHTGGELSPKAGLWAGFGYGLNAELPGELSP